MNEENDIFSKVESFLTDELIAFESEKFSLPHLIPRTSYQSFYTSFSNLKNILIKQNVVTFLINAIKESQNFPNTELNLYSQVFRSLQSHVVGVQYESYDKRMHNHDIKPRPTDTKHLYKQSIKSSANEGYDSVFGVSFLLEHCDLPWLSSIRSIANRLLPTSMESFSLPPTIHNSTYIPIQSLLSITGKSMFLGSFYPSVNVFDFRIDFLMAIIDGNGSNVAAATFYDVISHHLKMISESLGAIVLDLMVPNVVMIVEKTKSKSVPPKPIPKCDGQLLWTYRDWKNDALKPREEITKLAQIYINSGTITPIPFIVVQLAVSTSTSCDLSVAKNGYQKIRIAYVPHTLQMKDSKEKGEIWSCFGKSENQFVHHIFESLFLQQSHAEAFMALVLHQSLLVTNVSGSGTSDSRNKRLYPETKINSTKSDQEVTSIFRIFKFPDDNGGIIKQNTTEESGVDDIGVWEKSLSVSEKLWAENIVKLDLVMDFFAILENIIKLRATSSSLIPGDVDRGILEAEVKMILKSSILNLNHVIQANIFLREVIYCFHEHGKSEFVVNLFRNFLTEIENVLLRISSQHNLSFLVGLVGKILKRSKKFLLSDGVDVQIRKLLKPKIMLELRYYNNLCYALLWQMLGNLLLRCPNLKTTIVSLSDQFPYSGKGAKVTVDEVEFFQEIDFLPFFQTNDVAVSDPVPEDIISTLKTVDFSWCWRLFLTRLLNNIETDQNVESFSLLCEVMNVAAMKLDTEVVFAKNGATDYSYMQIECVDAGNFLYKSVNSEAYGLRSALLLFDSVAFYKLKEIISHLDHILYEKSSGLFEVVISTGLVGQVPYHGKIDPCLRLVDFVDNIYITGPDSCLEEGSQVFAQTVVKHVLAVSTAIENSLVMGLFMPEISQIWSTGDLTRNPREAMIQIARCARQSGSVFTRIFVPFQWRYLNIVKHFRFHFVNFQKRQYFNSTVGDNRCIEPFRLVFFTLVSAQRYFRNCGFLKVMDDPFSAVKLAVVNLRIEEIITESHKTQNLMNLYRALVTKSMIDGSLDFVEEASRIFHGTLGQLDYLNSLNKTMQGVIFHLMESKTFTVEEPINVVKEKQKGGKKPQLSSSDILNSTFRGYYVMLKKVFENKNLGHIHLKDVLLSLLDEVLKSDVQGGISVLPNGATVIKLEQIRQILEYMEAFYGYYSLQFCQKSSVYIQSRPPGITCVTTNGNCDEFEHMFALRMIKSDGFEQWSTDPDYGYNI